MGTIDSNGIYKYDITDGAPTPPVLNLGMQSVSDALAGVKRQPFYVVADVPARAALVATQTSAGRGPSAANPLYVHRINAGEGNELERTFNGSSWQTISANPGQVIQSIGAGGGSIGTNPTTPNSGASVDLPAGNWLVNFRMNFSLSVSSTPRIITLWLAESGVGNNISSHFPVERTGITSRQHSSFEYISRDSPSRFYLRGSTSALGGTQAMSSNKIVAVRTL